MRGYPKPEDPRQVQAADQTLGFTSLTKRRTKALKKKDFGRRVKPLAAKRKPRIKTLVTQASHTNLKGHPKWQRKDGPLRYAERRRTAKKASGPLVKPLAHAILRCLTLSPKHRRQPPKLFGRRDQCIEKEHPRRSGNGSNPR